jgi:hypothetical protein
MARKKKVKYGCPWCRSTENFTESNIIEAEADVNGFAPDGSPDYGGQSDVDWDSQRIDPKFPRPYTCKNCGEQFEKPFPVTETYPEREMTPAQLRAKFDSLADDSRWGEHHRFKMENWREAVVNGDTRLGYWEWVSHLIEMDL